MAHALIHLKKNYIHLNMYEVIINAFFDHSFLALFSYTFLGYFLVGLLLFANEHILIFLLWQVCGQHIHVDGTTNN